MIFVAENDDYLHFISLTGRQKDGKREQLDNEKNFLKIRQKVSIWFLWVQKEVGESIFKHKPTPRSFKRGIMNLS